jgi:hypothetical protein
LIDPSILSKLKIGMYIDVSFTSPAGECREGGNPQLVGFGYKHLRIRGVIVRQAFKMKLLRRQAEVSKLNQVENREDFLILSELGSSMSWQISVENITDLEIVPITFEDLLTCDNEELRKLAIAFLDFKNK